MLSSFKTKFPAECLYCYEQVEVGEQAAYYKNDFMHFDCATEAENEDKREELEKMKK